MIKKKEIKIMIWYNNSQNFTSGLALKLNTNINYGVKRLKQFWLVK